MAGTSFNTAVTRLGEVIKRGDDQVWRLLSWSDKNSPTYVTDKNGNLDSAFKTFRLDIPEHTTGEIDLGAFGKLFDTEAPHQEVKLKSIQVIFGASGKGDRFTIAGLHAPLYVDTYNTGAGSGIACGFNNPQGWAGHVDVLHARYYKVELALAFSVYVTVEYLIDRTVYS